MFEFWRNKSVLIAGAGGLIGAALARLLRNQCNRLELWRRADGDLRDPAAAAAAIARGPFDAVFLMAATQGGIADHHARPISFVSDNARIALNVIEAAAAAGVTSLVYAASGALYPDRGPADDGRGFREDEIASGPIDAAHQPYAAAKLLGVRLCEAYVAERGLRYAPAVIGNTYGPGGSFEPGRSTLVHAMIARAEETRRAGGRTLSVWGTGRAYRDILYADDVALALLLVAQSGCAAPTNVASGINRSVRDIAGVIAQSAGLDDVEFDPGKPEGALSRPVDISRLAALGFSPRIDFAEGVRRTRDAYLAVAGARS